MARGIFQPVYLNSMRLTRAITTSKANDVTDYYVAVLFLALTQFGITFVCLLVVYCGNHRVMSLRPPIRIRGLVTIGFFNFLVYLCFSYASSPARTPPQLQAVIMTSVVPSGVLVHRAFFREWVSPGRLVCAFVVVVGLVISLEPVLFNMPIAQDPVCRDGVFPKESDDWKMVWCGVFALSSLPRAFRTVISDKEMKLRGLTNVHLLVLIAWINFVIVVFALFFVWIDLLPFPGGTADGSVERLGQALRQGLACSYGMAVGDYSNFPGQCKMASLWGWLYVLSSFCVSLGLFGLTKYSANAVQTIIVSAIVTPVSTLFWMLFTICPVRF